MKRFIIFILICLVFGATMSITVAWWATLREWEFPDYHTFAENSWKGGLEYTPAYTLIGAIPYEQSEFVLERYEITVGSDYLPKVSPPAWFSLSTKPASETAIIRSIGTGWPLTCVVVRHEIEKETFFPEWDLVKSGGLIGTNPFDINSQYIWNRNTLPVRIIPFGLFINAIIFGSMLAFPVTVFRLDLGQRATYHHKRKRCPFCKYDMSRSTSDVCSECGADSRSKPQVVSSSTNVLISILTIVLIMSLVGFGVVFTNKFPFSKIHYAAYCGDLETVRSELAAGEDIDAEAYTYNRFDSGNTDTPLLLASANGETEVVQLLIDSGAVLELESSIGATALHMALSSGSLKCVMLLLENGADVNAKFYEVSDALWFIACNPDNDPRLLDIILEAGYNFEANSSDIDAAIDIAVARENEKFIHQIMELGGVPGYQALSSAVGKGRVDLLELFVERGADFNKPTEYSWPIFHYVSAENNPKEIVEFLTNSGQQINVLNKMGSSALMFAAAGLHTDLCQVLLTYGAEPNMRNDNGMNALDYAIFYGQGDKKEIVSVLLDAGSEVQLHDEKGKLRYENLDPVLENFLKEKQADQ